MKVRNEEYENVNIIELQIKTQRELYRNLINVYHKHEI